MLSRIGNWSIRARGGISELYPNGEGEFIDVPLGEYSSYTCTLISTLALTLAPNPLQSLPALSQ